MPALRKFCAAVSRSIRLILSALSTSLQLRAGERLEEMHRTHLQSPDIIRLLKYSAFPASEKGASHVAHTDLGSLTFLFTEQLGLQVNRSPGELWEPVEPRPGYATVNIGDSLSMLSGGLFKSCCHRVAPPNAGGPREERYSFAYLCRAEDHIKLQAVSSPLIQQSSMSSQDSRKHEIFTSAEWLGRKFQALRAESWGAENHSLLDGRNLAI